MIRKRNHHPKALRQTVRPSFRSALPALILASMLAAGVDWLASRYSVGPLFISLEWLNIRGSFPLPVAVLVFMVLASRPIILLIDSYYIVGKHHLYAIVGRISLRRRLIEVPYEDMRGVRCEQGLIERLFGVGSVIVWTASAESQAVTMTGVGAPDLVVNELRRRIDHARLKRPHASPGEDLEIQHRAA